MKSGKTSRIAYRLRKLKHLEDVDFIAFKPSTDTRTDEIQSREGDIIKSVTIPSNNPRAILDYVKNQKVIVFSEAQFFSEQIAEVAEYLLQRKCNLIIEGLNLDFRGEPFGMMPYFLARADHIEVLTAVCDCMICNGENRMVHCPNPATRTQRLINGKPAPYDSPIVLVGDKKIEGAPTQSYEARCLEHHIVPGNPRRYDLGI